MKIKEEIREILLKNDIKEFKKYLLESDVSEDFHTAINNMNDLELEVLFLCCVRESENLPQDFKDAKMDRLNEILTGTKGA